MARVRLKPEPLTLEHVLEIRPAWDKRATGHGIHGVEMCFYAKGPEGAVQFLLFTNWTLSLATDDGVFSIDRSDLRPPLPVDLGYHSPKPLYDGQTILDQNCSVIGCPCYYDGSGLNAQGAFNALIRGGDNALWQHLDEYYRDVFLRDQPTE